VPLLRPLLQAASTNAMSKPDSAASLPAAPCTAEAGAPSASMDDGPRTSIASDHQLHLGRSIAPQQQSTVQSQRPLRLWGAWPAADQPMTGIINTCRGIDSAEPHAAANLRGGLPGERAVQHHASVLTAGQRLRWMHSTAPGHGLGTSEGRLFSGHACGVQQARHYATGGGAWSKGYQVGWPAPKPCQRGHGLNEPARESSCQACSVMGAALLCERPACTMRRSTCVLSTGVQSQAKRAARDNSAPEVDTGPKLRVNQQITAPFVRLVLAEGGHQV